MQCNFGNNSVPRLSHSLLANNPLFYKNPSSPKKKRRKVSETRIRRFGRGKLDIYKVGGNKDFFFLRENISDLRPEDVALFLPKLNKGRYKFV